jgi:hypothetical protein
MKHLMAVDEFIKVLTQAKKEWPQSEGIKAIEPRRRRIAWSKSTQ